MFQQASVFKGDPKLVTELTVARNPAIQRLRVWLGDGPILPAGFLI